MKEAQFQAAVTHAAQLLGWRVYSIPDSRRATSRGYPDLTLHHRAHGLVFAELKTETGRRSTDQAAWLADLTHTGHRAYLWRPSDWPVIENVLRGRA